MKYKNLKVGLRVKVKNHAMVNWEIDDNVGRDGVVVEFEDGLPYNVKVKFDNNDFDIFSHEDLKIIKEEN